MGLFFRLFQMHEIASGNLEKKWGHRVAAFINNLKLKQATMKNTFKYFLCLLLVCSGMFMLTSCKEKSATEQLKDDIK